MIEHFDGVIFDVDGVIADSERVNAEASIEVFAELFGLRVVRADFEAGLGRGAANRRTAGNGRDPRVSG